MFQLLSSHSELIGSGLVHGVDVFLVEKNEEDDVIAKASDSVQGRHLDHERKDVIDECVQRLVRQHSPGQVGDRLHFVVDEQLRSHHDEAEGEEEPVHHAQHVRVPPFVLVVDQRVDGITKEQGNEGHSEVLESQSVVLLSRRFCVRRLLLKLERNET